MRTGARTKEAVKDLINPEKTDELDREQLVKALLENRLSARDYELALRSLDLPRERTVSMGKIPRLISPNFQPRNVNDRQTTPMEAISSSLDIYLNISLGLLCLHSADIVHRDLKPGNFLAPFRNHPARITDFGSIYDLMAPPSTKKFGITPLYLPPIFCNPPTKSNDVYSFGMSLMHDIENKVLPALLKKSTYAAELEKALDQHFKYTIPKPLSDDDKQAKRDDGYYVRRHPDGNYYVFPKESERRAFFDTFIAKLNLSNDEVRALSEMHELTLECLSSTNAKRPDIMTVYCKLRDLHKRFINQEINYGEIESFDLANSPTTEVAEWDPPSPEKRKRLHPLDGEPSSPLETTKRLRFEGVGDPSKKV